MSIDVQSDATDSIRIASQGLGNGFQGGMPKRTTLIPGSPTAVL